VEEIATDLGVSSWSLYQWSKRFGNDQGMMRRNRRPGDRSGQEKVKAVIEFEGLESDKQGEYLAMQSRRGLNLGEASIRQRAQREPRTSAR
jgi:hypothetical protein